MSGILVDPDQYREILLFLSVVLRLLQYILLHYKDHFQANGRNSSANHTTVPSCHMTSTYHTDGETDSNEGKGSCRSAMCRQMTHWLTMCNRQTSIKLMWVSCKPEGGLWVCGNWAKQCGTQDSYRCVRCVCSKLHDFRTLKTTPCLLIIQLCWTKVQFLIYL